MCFSHDKNERQFFKGDGGTMTRACTQELYSQSGEMKNMDQDEHDDRKAIMNHNIDGNHGKMKDSSESGSSSITLSQVPSHKEL